MFVLIELEIRENECLHFVNLAYENVVTGGMLTENFLIYVKFLIKTWDVEPKDVLTYLRHKANIIVVE